MKTIGVLGGMSGVATGEYYRRINEGVNAHRVADEVQGAVSIPMLHIVDATADAAIADGAKTLGLLGTAPVMESDFYRQRFADLGLTVLVPAQRDRDLVHRIIFEELTRGVIDDHSRQESLRIMQDLVAQGAQGSVLGCTEISLLVAATDMPGTALYDTTALHVDRAVRISLGRPASITDPVPDVE